MGDVERHTVRPRYGAGIKHERRDADAKAMRKKVSTTEELSDCVHLSHC